MMTDASKQIIRRHFEEVLSKGNLAVADEILAPDLVINGLQTLRDRDSFKHVLTKVIREAFPDLTYEVEDEFGDESKIAVRFTMRATHLGDYLGVAPTGQQIEITGISIFELSEGRIQQIWTEIDFLTLIHRLGAVPSI